jgi:excisionase family DNA binding protein
LQTTCSAYDEGRKAEMLMRIANPVGVFDYKQKGGYETMLENYGDILSVEELCDILKICPTTAYKYLHSDIIPHRRIGKKYYIAKKNVIEYLSNP